ncbi:MAG TPA: ABC transporter permease [Aquificae bacterium]|nr:ABC transporter permease [Aquificota bacterium]
MLKMVKALSNFAQQNNKRPIRPTEAINALRSKSFFDFLSFLLSFLGAIFGMVVAILLQILICKIAKWPFVLSYKVITISIILSSILGVLAGIYPAIKASKLDPKEILYTE